MFTALALAASIALAMLEPVAAPPPPPPAPAKGAHQIDLPVAGVTNSGDAGSSIVEAVIDAPVKRVWEVFSTDEGFKALGSAQARVDFRVGGLIRSTYDPRGTLEDDGHIENEIIAFDPERMMSIRIHRPPANFDFPNAWKKTWSVITMEPVGPDHTRLRLAMLGFTPDKESQAMKDFFNRGNAYTLGRLRDALGSAEVRRKTDKAWALITSLVGDTWRGCTNLEDGRNVCARTLWTYGPNQKSVIFSIWLNDVPGASAHIHQVISPDTATGTIVYTAVDDAGSVMSGHVTLTADDTVTMDWNSELPDGTKSHQFVTLTIPSPGTYTQRNYSSAADLALCKPWVTMTYTHPGASAPQQEAVPPAPSKSTSMIDTSLFVARGLAEPGVTAQTVVRASPAEVFRAWATPEGMKSALEIDNNIDLRIGGPFELFFGGQEVPAGSRGSEGCQILSYVPDRMLSFSWNAPPKFTHERSLRTWVTVMLSPVDGGTRIELSHVGFGSDGRWNDVRQYFASAWPQVLDAFRDHFEPGATGVSQQK